MGRPKGSLNKKRKNKVVIFKRKRGRPKKIVISPPPPEPSNVKKLKFIGFCSKCKGIIGKTDLESKFIFLCPSCGKRDRVKTLKKETGNRPASRKEFMDPGSLVNADHYQMPGLQEHQLGPKDLKISE